jgi:hypothetical protein
VRRSSLENDRELLVSLLGADPSKVPI